MAIVQTGNPIANDVFLSDDEKNAIVSKFPEKLRPFLSDINNPLDETQVLVNLFKDKNVRIILREEENDFGEFEWTSYYHCEDMAKEINFDPKNINNWNKNWKIELIKYENLHPKKIGQHFIELNKRKTNVKANYINEQELKKVLIKLNSPEARIFQDWILKQSTIMKTIIKHVIKIKHTHELEVERNNAKAMLEAEQKKALALQEQLDTAQQELAKRTNDAHELYKSPKYTAGSIYIASSDDMMKKCMYKIGQTTKHLHKRESALKTGNIDINMLHCTKSKCVDITEKLIHSLLEHLNVNREFFYLPSLDDAKSLVDDVSTAIDKIVSKYGRMHDTLRMNYILAKNNMPLQITDGSNKKNNSVASEWDVESFCDKYITQTNNKLDYILQYQLIAQHRKWFIDKYNENPNVNSVTKDFVDKYFHCKASHLPEHVNLGWQGYKLIDVTPV